MLPHARIAVRRVLPPPPRRLGVVVNVQDITAQHADGATTLSSN